MFELLKNPLVLIGIAVFVVMNWGRIKPVLDRLRGVTPANPDPTISETAANLRRMIREEAAEAIARWMNDETTLDPDPGEPSAHAIGVDGGEEILQSPAALDERENALDAAVHNWLRLRRGVKDTKQLDELFRSFPETYLEPKPNNAT